MKCLHCDMTQGLASGHAVTTHPELNDGSHSQHPSGPCPELKVINNKVVERTCRTKEDRESATGNVSEEKANETGERL